MDPRHKNGGAQKHKKTCEVASKLAQFSGFHSLFTSNLTIHSISSPNNLTWSGLVPSSHARHFQLVPRGDSVRVSSLGRWVEIPMGDRFPSYKPLVTHSSSTDILWKCQSKTKYNKLIEAVTGCTVTQLPLQLNANSDFSLCEFPVSGGQNV